MPTLKEAAVAVTGTVLDIEATTDFETKKPDGNYQIVVASGDGFARVKVMKEDVDDAHFELMRPVSWMVRFGAWARNENATVTSRFVRQVTDNDLDKLNSGKAALAASGGK